MQKGCDTVAQDNEEPRQLIIDGYWAALRFYGEGENALLIAAELLTTAIERTVTLIYLCQRSGGMAKASLVQPTFKDKCEVVSLVIAEAGVAASFTAALDTFSELRRLAAAVKHQVAPRTDGIADKLMLAQWVLAQLFAYHFGQPLPLDDEAEEDATLGSMPIEESVAFVVSCVRRRIAPSLTPEEMQLFNTLPLVFIGGVADPVTLRRAGTWEAWHKLAAAGLRDISPVLMQSTPNEAEALLADRAVQALLDLKSFIAAEAWHYRRAGKYASTAHLSSDPALAMLSIGERFGWLAPPD
jgi:hypothetical protein